ncbi:MAG TPA: hypothetical protein VFH54_09745, partial [Mycobacteriales bacterium]|nr:hypothetical protein [Mycobacteriales bacterium]
MTEPTFFPTESGVLDVFRRARRRRWRTAGLTGAAVTAVVVGATVLAWPGTGNGADRLSVVPASPSPRPSASTGVRPATPAGTRPTVAAGTSAGAAAASGGTTASGIPGLAPLTGGISPKQTGPRHSAAAPIRRTTVSYTGGCDPTAGVVGWCELYSGPTTAHRKHPVTLSIELCRPSVDGDASVSFYDTREIDLELSDGDGTTDWVAGQGEQNRQVDHSVL